jgi:dTDP-4-dehydrorhamnose reductase
LKILVIGGSGTVGSQLVKKFGSGNEDFEFTVNKNKIDGKNQKVLDITKEQDTFELIQKSNPDIVINATALTNLDLCEDNHGLADSINIDGTANIIEGCKNTKSKICQISTSVVFDGKEEEYVEEDSTSPGNYYGFTKMKAEQLVQGSGLKYLILRTDCLYGWTKKFQRENPVMRVINTLKSGKIFKEITDWYNTPTYIPDFISASNILIKNHNKGIYHITGSDYTDRFSLAIKIAEIFNLNKKLLIPINSNLLNLSAKRANVNLKNTKIVKQTGIQMKGIIEGLIQMQKDEQ